MSLKLEHELDDARNERDELEGWIYDEGIRSLNEVVDHVARHVNARPAAIKACKESLQDALNDLTHEARTEIENRITALENAVSAAEDRDLRGNSPVVL